MATFRFCEESVGGRQSNPSPSRNGLLRHSVPRTDRVAGFTLIEILVVLFIISIVSTVALLTISKSDAKEVEYIAKQISQMVTLAEEQAIVQSKVLGLSIKSHGFTFTSFKTGDVKQKDTWQPLQETALKQQTVPSDMQLKVDVGNAAHESSTQNPQIIISTNGDVTPFTIYIGKKGQKPLYAVTGDADGHVTTKLLS